jgi:Skp family chaperone for outer membrane proteins
MLASRPSFDMIMALSGFRLAYNALSVKATAVLRLAQDAIGLASDAFGVANRLASELAAAHDEMDARTMDLETDLEAALKENAGLRGLREQHQQALDAERAKALSFEHALNHQSAKLQELTAASQARNESIYESARDVGRKVIASKLLVWKRGRGRDRRTRCAVARGKRWATKRGRCVFDDCDNLAKRARHRCGSCGDGVAPGAKITVVVLGIC